MHNFVVLIPQIIDWSMYDIVNILDRVMCRDQPSLYVHIWHVIINSPAIMYYVCMLLACSNHELIIIIMHAVVLYNFILI